MGSRLGFDLSPEESGLVPAPAARCGKPGCAPPASELQGFWAKMGRETWILQKISLQRFRCPLCPQQEAVARSSWGSGMRLCMNMAEERFEGDLQHEAAAFRKLWIPLAGQIGRRFSPGFAGGGDRALLMLRHPIILSPPAASLKSSSVLPYRRPIPHPFTLPRALQLPPTPKTPPNPCWEPAGRHF